MANAHEQIDTIITNNTLKDFLIAASQDETFAAGRVSDPLRQLQSNQWKVSKAYNPTNPKALTTRQHLQSKLPQKPLAHLNKPEAYNLDRMLRALNKGEKPLSVTRAPRGGPGFGVLGGVMALAPALQELLYYSMGLDPSGLENQPPEFPHLSVGSSYESGYETKYPRIPQRIEPILPKDINIR